MRQPAATDAISIEAISTLNGKIGVVVVYSSGTHALDSKGGLIGFFAGKDAAVDAILNRVRS